MQNLDPAGNYSDEEVKEALSGANGTRDWAFRYERLDKNNRYIEDIDYVSSCTIDNNIFADIKRTANFTMHDQGNINYLQDRIKPFVRLNMPKTEGYSDVIERLEPGMWWKFDDVLEPQTLVQLPVVTVPTGLTQHNTRELALKAYPARGYNSFSVRMDVNNTAVRKETWFEIDPEGANSFVIWHGLFNTELYFASTAESELELVKAKNNTEKYVGSLVSNPTTVMFPRKGLYYLKVTANPISTTPANATIGFSPVRLIQDSSKNKSAGYTGNYLDIHLSFGAPGIVQDGGKALMNKTSGGQTTVVEAEELDIPLRGGFTYNFWMKGEPVTPGTSGVNMSFDFGTDSQAIISSYQQDWTTAGQNRTFFGVNKNGSSVLLSNDTPRIVDNRVHMITFVGYADNRGEMYVDGKLVHSVANLGKDATADYSTVFNTESIRSAKISVLGGAGNKELSVDDFTVFGHPVPQDQLAEIYRKGLAPSRSNRRGYVEWPQGVFLLSSPKRTLEDGNTTSREVEAYDQLLALREDSYDYRYTARKGANCIEILKRVLGTETRRNLVLDPELRNVSKYTGQGTHSYMTLTRNQPSRPGGPAEGLNATATLTWSALPADGVQHTGIEFPVDPSVINEEIHYSIWVRSSAPCMTQLVGPATMSPAVFLKPNEWTKYSLPSTSLRWGSKAIMWVTGATTSSGKFDFTEPVVERKATSSMSEAGEWFSGNTPDSTLATNGWTGAINNSVSVQDSLRARITASPQTFTEAMEWDPGVSKLQIINDILAYINYESAWYDENGIFIGQPYLTPDRRPSEFRYATDADSVITADEISQSLDLFSIPNKWILVVADPETPPMVASYVNNNPMSPTSTVARGRTIVDYREEQSASDQATLNAKAERLAFEASQVYEKVEFSTGLMPIHSNGDTYDIIVDDLAISNKYSETAWSLTMEAGSSMSHQVRRIVQT